MKELESAGVKHRLRQVPGSNGYTLAFVFPDGERRFVSNKGGSGMMEVSDLTPILKGIRPGDIVYAGGYFHLPGLSKGFAGFLKSAKNKGATLMFDFTFHEKGCTKYFRDFAGYMDMVFMNDDELKRLGKGTIKKTLEWMSGLGVRDIIVKQGKRGSVFYTNGMLIREPSEKVRAVDSTGAGDVFNAAFVYGFITGLLPEECLRLGNYAASWKVARSGIEVPPREKIHSFVKKMTGRSTS